MPSFIKLKKKLFNFSTRRILNTESINCDPSSPVIILSQSYLADLTMFLIAAKSFARFVRPKYFVVIDDGLGDEGRRTVQQHLGDVRFIRTEDVDVGSCPRRGCWERLVSVADFSRDGYVVQLDSDTVTVTFPDEVLACIAENRSFTLSTFQGREVVSVEQASRFADEVDSTHVQILAERALKTLPNSGSRRYVRGCAGFAGFAKDAISIDQLREFSEFMQRAIGTENWNKWGSEQVASNYMIANTQEPLMLPIENYPYWKPGIALDRAKLIHFIGDHRFHQGEYARQARKVISALR